MVHFWEDIWSPLWLIENLYDLATFLAWRGGFISRHRQWIHHLRRLVHICTTLHFRGVLDEALEVRWEDGVNFFADGSHVLWHDVSSVVCLLGSLVHAFWRKLWQEFLGWCCLFKLKQLSLGWRLIQWLLHPYYHTRRMPLITSTIIHHRCSTFSILPIILAYVALNNILGC